MAGDLRITKQSAYVVMLQTPAIRITKQTAYVVMLPIPANTRRRQVVNS